jgi:hypothetical protein
MKISEKVLHFSRLGMSYADIAHHLGVNLWMAKKAARWGKGQTGLTHMPANKIM